MDEGKILYGVAEFVLENRFKQLVKVVLTDIENGTDKKEVKNKLWNFKDDILKDLSIHAKTLDSINKD